MMTWMDYTYEVRTSSPIIIEVGYVAVGMASRSDFVSLVAAKSVKRAR
jgi:hypothetical protein